MDRHDVSNAAAESEDQSTKNVGRRQVLKASGAGLMLFSASAGGTTARSEPETWNAHDFVDEYLQIASDRRAVSALLALDERQRQMAVKVLRNRLQRSDSEVAYTPPIRVARTYADLN